jgi:hypothetical protein
VSGGNGGALLELLRETAARSPDLTTRINV